MDTVRSLSGLRRTKEEFNRIHRMSRMDGWTRRGWMVPAFSSILSILIVFFPKSPRTGRDGVSPSGG
jgi:hypothetical protein